MERGFTILDQCVAVENVCAWPNLTQLPDQTILAAIYNRPCHLVAEGDVECWASTDGGKTWTLRGTPAPHEPGTARANIAVGLAHNGDLVVLASGWGYAPGFRDRRLSPWVCRSPDGGRTWSMNKSRSAVVFPEGADYEDRGQRMIKPFGDIVPLPEQKLAASFYHDWGMVWILFSSDDGHTWGDAALLTDDHRGETAVLRLRADRWLAASRIEGGPPDRTTPHRGMELFVSENEGRTWTPRGPLTEPSHHPGHLLRLSDGRILLTYGMRDIYGIGMRVSHDEGRTWDSAQVLVHLQESDLGYPATVQLDDETLVTAYYTSADHYHMGVVRWKLDDA
ncbi:MAG: exo-alpha-sialidase [Planctomycetes bacterium]|nr:exo-alpha-sialidase [Planctomycetota bacterium]